MNRQQQLVLDFHRACDVMVSDRPTSVSREERDSRIHIIEGELTELKESFAGETIDLVAAADALADILYGVYGTALVIGIDIEPIFAEVHRSNMSKAGGGKDEKGKLRKPPTYVPPDIKPILDAQASEKIPLVLEAGDEVTVYFDPHTCERPEARATLIECTGIQPDGWISFWRVEFLGEPGKIYDRVIRGTVRGTLKV